MSNLERKLLPKVKPPSKVVFLFRAIPFKYIREGGRGSTKMFEKKLDTIPRETNAKLYL